MDAVDAVATMAPGERARVEIAADLAQWQVGAWYSDAAVSVSNALMTEVTNGALATVQLNAGTKEAPRQFLRVRVRPQWQE